MPESNDCRKTDEGRQPENASRTSHECDFCGASFLTVNELYQHQMDRHDPDGIMFSELGLPK